MYRTTPLFQTACSNNISYSRQYGHQYFTYTNHLTHRLNTHAHTHTLPAGCLIVPLGNCQVISELLINITKYKKCNVTKRLNERPSLSSPPHPVCVHEPLLANTVCLLWVMMNMSVQISELLRRLTDRHLFMSLAAVSQSC